MGLGYKWEWLLKLDLDAFQTQALVRPDRAWAKVNVRLLYFGVG